MAMKHLKALSSGLQGKNNVFIPNINDVKTNTFQKVVVFVPGIMATVERRPNDSLVVTDLVLSDEYKSIERGSQVKPGVYSVKKTGNRTDIEYRSSKRITPENNRNVAIADTRYNSPLLAAQKVEKKLKAMFGSSAAQKCDFDLFYSPTGCRLGGMSNYNPVILNQAYAFGGLLADAIEQSQKQKGVEWTSEGAGSVVLTQALMALSHKNLSFEEQNHIIKMCWPTTDPNPTYAAATQLGMLVDKDLLKGNGNIRAIASALLTNAARARNRDDSYSWGDYGNDLASGAMVTNALVGAGALVGVAATGSPLLGAVGTVSGVIGALQFAYSVAQKRRERG
jgi:hypothetical protein